MLDEGRAGFRAVTADDVDDAVRQSRFDERLNQVVGGERRILRRLDDTGVPADQGREELPRGNGHGKIPGRDHADDTDRHTHRHGKFIL